ncbi:hypothetical protein EEB15_29985 [Ramlibacter sp. WS9]|nr:hypothetical protein EEB15_29985 [Ramlibacter sp. WS9]
MIAKTLLALARRFHLHVDRDHRRRFAQAVPRRDEAGLTLLALAPQLPNFRGVLAHHLPHVGMPHRCPQAVAAVEDIRHSAAASQMAGQVEHLPQHPIGLGARVSALARGVQRTARSRPAVRAHLDAAMAQQPEEQKGADP